MLDTKAILGIVAIIIVIGVTASVGIFVMDDVGDKLKEDNTASHEDHNVTVGLTFTLTHNEVQSIDAVVFGVNGTVIPDTNWTLTNADTGFVTLDETKLGNKTVNWTYTYLNDTIESGATDDAISAVADIPTWLSIIVVVVMAVVILGLIGKAFMAER